MQFRDASSGRVEGWLWEFGDGATSHEQHPAHEYWKAGRYTVRLTVTGPGGGDRADLEEAVQVEPGPPTRVEVSPRSVAVQVNGSILLTARVWDQFGNEVTDAEVSWTMTNEEGSIDHTGLFTADTRAGSYEGLIKVTARKGEKSTGAQVDVTVRPGPLASAIIEPAAVTIDIQSTEQFTLKGLDAFGNEIIDLDARWVVTQPVGTIDATGKYTASTIAGTFRGLVLGILLQGDTKVQAKADVSVLPGPIFRLTLEPARATARPGSSLRFTVAAYDAFRNPIPGSLLMTEWHASGGSVDPSGEFTAPSDPGPYRVEVAVEYKGQRVTQQAEVAVGEPPGIIVKLTYNGQPLADFTEAEPTLLLFNAQTNIGSRVNSIFFPGSKTYFIPTVATGEYYVQVDGVDVDGNGLRLAGDFWAPRGAPRVLTMDAETIAVTQVEMVRVLHLAWPFDNSATHPGMLEEGKPKEPDTFPAGPALFEWDAVPEAAYYTVQVLSQSGPGVDTTTTEGRMTVELTAGDYRLVLKAHNENGNVVGWLVVNYANGWSTAYHFRIS